MNGAVIASPEDETSIFYNPGAMGLDENIGFAFSLVTPTYADLKTTNFLGNGKELVDTELGLAPGFLAVRLRPFKNKKWILGIASFRRFKKDIRFTKRAVEKISFNNNDLLRADINFSHSIKEDWYALAIGYSFSKSFSVGFSQYSVWRTERFKSNAIKEIAQSNNPEVINYSWRYNFDYNLSLSNALITKIGLAYKNEHIRLGLTYTSPLYHISQSKVRYALDDQRYSVGTGLSVNANRDGSQLREYRTAQSIGFGIEYAFYNCQIALSTEYFYSVNRFDYFNTSDDAFEGLSEEPNIVSTSVGTQFQRVINAALGFQYIFNRKVTLIGGLRSDFNPNSDLFINDLGQFLSATPDVYHASFGALMKKEKNFISFGIDLGVGVGKNGNQFIDLNNITPENLYTFSGNNNVRNRFYSIGLFFTYDFIFSGIGN